MRREFALPEEDVEFLEAFGLPWETIRDGSGQWLLLHKFPYPEGYVIASGSVAISVTSGYPTAKLDMAYFHPALSRNDGQALRQTQVNQQVDCKQWQRWSRHYDWVPGRHNLGTHILLVKHWLLVALGKEAA
jgi:hypothetical protein